MMTVVDGGEVRCGLVVRPGAEVDDALLERLDGFAFIGNGGFGAEAVADVYGAGDDLLIEAAIPELGVKTMMIWAGSVERAVALREIVGDHFQQVWTERILRDQVRGALPDGAWTLVAMMMALGGGPAERETLELLRECQEHADEGVREAADYAEKVAKELLNPPMVMREEPRGELAWALRPAAPVDGEQNWVTVRAGVPERAVPRPVIWLRVAADDAESWIWDTNLDMRVLFTREDSPWSEAIYTSRDGRTAIHIVRHTALGHDVAAVHGDDALATAASLSKETNGELLDGPPDGWERTAP
ncbi:hypothetical protein [Actinomadura vinacea]